MELTAEETLIRLKEAETPVLDNQKLDGACVVDCLVVTGDPLFEPKPREALETTLAKSGISFEANPEIKPDPDPSPGGPSFNPESGLG